MGIGTAVSAALHVGHGEAEAVAAFLNAFAALSDPTFGFLAIGLLVGMGHALEADHLAAVGAIAADNAGPGRRRRFFLQGAAWGLGHTITLFAICLAALAFGLVLSEEMSAALEFGVGVLLVALGVDVFRRMRRKRIHFHAHDHGDGRPHLHAHSHEGATTPHAEDLHEHRHAAGLPVRALLVGLAHGAAGSAGLMALAITSTQDPTTALIYVALFGVGSMVGMAALSVVAAWPLGWAERGAASLHRALTASVAVLAIGLGAAIMLEAGPTAWGLF